MEYVVYDIKNKMEEPVNYDCLKNIITLWFDSDRDMIDFLENNKMVLADMLLRNKIKNGLKEMNMSVKKLCGKVDEYENAVVSNITSFLYDDRISASNCRYIDKICKILNISKHIINKDFFIQYNRLDWNIRNPKKRKLTSVEIERRTRYEQRFNFFVEHENENNIKMNKAIINFFDSQALGDTQAYGVAAKNELTMDILRQFESNFPDISQVVEIVVDSFEFTVKKSYRYQIIGRSPNEKFGLIIRFL